MKKVSRPAAVLLPAAVGGWLVVLAATGAAGEPALDFVSNTLDRARAILNGPAEARLPALGAEFDARVDLAAFAARAFGAGWGDLPAGQQDRFRAALRALFEARYLRGGSDRWAGRAVRLAGTEQDGGLTRVLGVVPHKEVDVDVVVVLRPRDGSWAAVDVVADELSLAESFHDQFAEYLRTHSVDDLIRQLEERAAPPP